MDRKKSKLSGFFDVINKLEDVVLAVLVIGMVVVIMLQIIGRVTGHPFPWTEETSRYLFLWMMFVALAAGLQPGAGQGQGACGGNAQPRHRLGGQELAQR